MSAARNAAGKNIWKKGRGKLGVLDPLLGSWIAHADSPEGPITVRRTFARVLKGSYVQLNTGWELSHGSYDEIAMFGASENGLAFWSFTSDGKQAHGNLADGSDIHPQAICFEAQMPAGLGRQAYWPDEEQGVHWVVEAMSKKGWKRFVHHHYLPGG